MTIQAVVLGRADDVLGQCAIAFGDHPGCAVALVVGDGDRAGAAVVQRARAGLHAAPPPGSLASPPGAPPVCVSPLKAGSIPASSPASTPGMGVRPGFVSSLAMESWLSCRPWAE